MCRLCAQLVRASGGRAFEGVHLVSPGTDSSRGRRFFGHARKPRVGRHQFSIADSSKLEQNHASVGERHHIAADAGSRRRPTLRYTCGRNMLRPRFGQARGDTMAKVVPGTLKVSNDCIADLAGYAALECYGVVGMADIDQQEGVARLLPANRLRKGIDVGDRGGQGRGRPPRDRGAGRQHGIRLGQPAEPRSSSFSSRSQSLMASRCVYISRECAPARRFAPVIEKNRGLPSHDCRDR